MKCTARLHPKDHGHRKPFSITVENDDVKSFYQRLHIQGLKMWYLKNTAGVL